jgi:hypothetical protein
VTILPQLERDLFNAAEKRLRPDAPAPDRRSGSPASSFRPRLGRAARGLPVILSVAVAIAVAVLAVVVLGRGHQASQRTTAIGRASPRAELIQALGVLRRPQTEADRRGLERFARELRASPAGFFGPNSKRWGSELDRRVARVVKVPFPAWRAEVLIAPLRLQRSPISGERPEEVHLSGWGAGTADAPTRDLVSWPPSRSVGQLLAHGLWGGPVVPGMNRVGGVVRGPKDVQDGVLLVPDGVTSIKLGRFTLSQDVGGLSTKALNVTLARMHGTGIVHDNIAAFQLAMPVYRGRPYHWTGPEPPPRVFNTFVGATVEDTWLDASGHVVRRTTTEIVVGVLVRVARAARH